MELFKPELSIFDPPTIQRSVEKSILIDVYPNSTNYNTGAIEFELVATDDYIDLNDTVLNTVASVTQADGSALKTTQADHDVAFVNAPLYSMFQDVIVHFNDKRVYGGDQLYGYKSMLGLLFSYSDAVLKQQVVSSGFMKDIAGQMDAAGATGNSAHVSRFGWNSSKLYIGKLLVDIFQQNRYLMNGVTIKIKLQKAPNEFALQCHTATLKPKFVINSAVLSVRKVRLGDTVMMQHTHALARVGRNAMYPYQHKVVCPYNITKGSQFFVQEKLFNGHLPKLVILAMVSSEAYVGAYTKNPFNFQHRHKLRWIKERW